MLENLGYFFYWKLRDSSLIRKFELIRFSKTKSSIEQKPSIKNCLIFDTSLYSNNLGDEIIMYYCNKVYEELGCENKSYLPTHIHPGILYEDEMETDKVRFVSGTNLLSYDIQKVNGWKYPKKISYLKNLCLLGVGWISYSESISKYTKQFYKTVLQNTFVHSVRDSYTERQLKKIGIYNVINTGCPTMWKLTNEHCKSIPKSKAKKAVTTITDYRQAPKQDQYMLNIVLQNYEEVYFWPQGFGDCNYLRQILTESEINKFNILERSLDAYNEILEKEEVDYIGTRLHAGIHAINKRRRAIIIAVDNRAEEIGKDTNLSVILRKDIKDLKDKIYGELKTDIHINQSNIMKWKEQFKY